MQLIHVDIHLILPCHATTIALQCRTWHSSVRNSLTLECLVSVVLAILVHTLVSVWDRTGTIICTAVVRWEAGGEGEEAGVVGRERELRGQGR